MKLKLHSAVDLITNSSTTIFTYCDGSVKAVKELVNEMLKVFGHEDKTFDDLFYVEVFLEDDYQYVDNDSFPELEEGVNKYEYLKDLKLKIVMGEVEKPEWMDICEEEEGWSGYQQSNYLVLIPKDEKYSELANKLLSYLNSTDHEATRDG